MLDRHNYIALLLTKQLIGSLCGCLLLGSSALAQVPGYLGKYVPISFDYHVAPRIGPFLQGDAPLEFNHRYSARVGYVAARNLSLGWSGSMFNTQVDFESTLTGMSGEATLSAWTTGPAVRIFSYERRGHLAPLGLFHQLELLFVQYRVEDPGGTYFPNKSPDLGTYQDILPIYAVGYQRIIHPFLVYHGSIQLGWLTNSFRNTPIDLRPIREASTERLRGFFLFNVSLGIGLILF